MDMAIIFYILSMVYILNNAYGCIEAKTMYHIHVKYEITTKMHRNDFFVI